jgi:glycosyltransferase involved in cell wall biosynthesis
VPHTPAGSYLVFLGAINKTKGTHEAIQAALLSKEDIVIAGTTYQSDEYFRQKVEPFVDGKQIKFIGPVAFKQKLQLLADAKAVLMPIQWDDPFPTVALESLASGTPVIAWNRSSMPEIIEDGKSGFLVSSIEEMAARVKDLSRIDRKACRSRAELLFDSRQMATRYVNLYETLLGVPSRPTTQCRPAECAQEYEHSEVHLIGASSRSRLGQNRSSSHEHAGHVLRVRRRTSRCP